MSSNRPDEVVPPAPAPEPVDVYIGLRNNILHLVPQEAGIEQSDAVPNVWGVLMEMGFETAVVTLVSLADGTTSLYFGNGGGMIGGGEQAPVAAASKAFVVMAERYLNRLTPTQSFPLPAVGRVVFYVMTFSGALTAEADVNTLARVGHDLTALFYVGQEVITQVRLAQGAKG